MDGAAGENITKNGGGGALSSDVAIRCAKAALLLSSLKSSPTHRRDTAIDDDDDIAEKEMKKEIGDLKVKVARERRMNKRIKIFGFLELLLLALLFADFRFPSCARVRRWSFVIDLSSVEKWSCSRKQVNN